MTNITTWYEIGWNSSLLACGPWFSVDQVGIFASIVAFVVVMPMVYYAYVKAFRYRVDRLVPLTSAQAVKIAIARTAMGIGIVGAGWFYFVMWGGGTGREWLPLVYLYGARLAAWWVVGKVMVKLHGRRMDGFVAGGMCINVAFDVAGIAGVFGGKGFLALTVATVFVLVWLLDHFGQRTSLQNRFRVEPHCHECQYNLKGNVSGVCPECGTPTITAVNAVK